jgi:hypothetical protein
MSKPRKRGGRPKGSSSKQRMAQALIAEGVQPLEAFARAGYDYPGRELKRQAGTVAEAQGKDPLAVLEAVARYGAPADAIAACAAILRACGDEPQQVDDVPHTLHVELVRDPAKVA